MIYGHIKKSKPKRLTKVEQAEYDAWLKSVGAMSLAKKSTKKVFTTTNKLPKLVIPADRNPKQFKSVDTGIGIANWNKKDKVTQYTGDKMIGVGTLHKSNAVPIFNNTEAEDIAKMRR